MKPAFLKDSRNKAIMSLALPIIGGMISQNIVNMIDTAMVGRLGADALAGVGLGSICHWFLMSFFTALGIGTQTVCSRRFGEKRYYDMQQTLYLAIKISLGVGFVVALVTHFFMEPFFGLLSDDKQVFKIGSEYLDYRLLGLPFVITNFCFRGYWNSVGKSSNYLKVILSIHCLNVFLNYCLIFGNFGFPEMGASGAAVATATAMVLGTILHSLLFLREEKGAYLNPQEEKNNPRLFSNLIKQSLPNGIQQFLLSASFMIFFRLASYIGVNALAATHILVTMVLTCILPSMGFGMACSSLIGRALGEKNVEKAKAWAQQTVKLGSFYMTLVGLIIVIFSKPILTIFTDDPAVLELANLPLIFMGFCQILDSVGLIYMYSLFGAGDNQFVMKVSVALQWLIYLPIAIFLVVYLKKGLLILWIANFCYRIIFDILISLRFIRGYWVGKEV